MPARTKSR